MALIGVITTIFGVGAVPAVSYSAAGKRHDAQCAKMSKSKRKRAELRTGCKKPKPTTTPTPATPTSTTTTTTAPTPVPGSSICNVPNLTGLTVVEAEASAAHAGCKVKLEGAPLKFAEIQTVAKQSPEAAQSAESVTVWVNPLCQAEVDVAPGVPGPTATPGPTGLVSGFYLDGGPDELFSNPGCTRPEQSPRPGSIEVLNESGTLVATVTSEAGHLVEIQLPAGTYELRATFLDGFLGPNRVHPIETESVEIRPGESVQLNFVWVTY